MEHYGIYYGEPGDVMWMEGMREGKPRMTIDQLIEGTTINPVERLPEKYQIILYVED